MKAVKIKNQSEQSADDENPYEAVMIILIIHPYRTFLGSITGEAAHQPKNTARRMVLKIWRETPAIPESPGSVQ